MFLTSRNFFNRSIGRFLLGALLPLLIAVVEIPLIAQRHHALILRPKIGSNIIQYILVYNSRHRVIILNPQQRYEKWMVYSRFTSSTNSFVYQKSYEGTALFFCYKNLHSTWTLTTLLTVYGTVPVTSEAIIFHIQGLSHAIKTQKSSAIFPILEYAISRFKM
jgi:hypothetical protein